MIYKFLSICLIFLFFISCSSKKPEGKTAAEVLYKEAKELMDAKRYLLATEKLNTIKSQYPYSFYATHAELMQADVLFLQENFVESAAAYILFRDLHPKHEKIIYVIWMTAESYFNQIPSTFDRDLTPAMEAIKYYTEIIEKYSSSEYKQNAIDKRNQCNQMLNSKEKYIADFYFKTKTYEAAKFHYKKIIEENKDDKIVKYSMIRLAETYLKLKEIDECLSYSVKIFDTLNESEKDKLSLITKKCNDQKK